MTNIKSTTGFPTSYIDGVRTLPLSPERVAQRRFFSFFFWNKSQLQSNKVCYKVSLCENFQRQCCIVRPFPHLTVHKFCARTLLVSVAKWANTLSEPQYLLGLSGWRPAEARDQIRVAA